MGHAASVELRLGLEPVGVHEAAVRAWSLELEEGIYEVAPVDRFRGAS